MSDKRTPAWKESSDLGGNELLLRQRLLRRLGFGGLGRASVIGVLADLVLLPLVDLRIPTKAVLLGSCMSCDSISQHI